MAKQDNVHGLPRDLTLKSLNQFSHRYGTTPDILQLARPNLAGNTKGYMAQKSPLTEVGERVEADYMSTDFNMVAPNNNKTVKNPNIRRSNSSLSNSGLLLRVYSWIISKISREFS